MQRFQLLIDASADKSSWVTEAQGAVMPYKLFCSPQSLYWILLLNVYSLKPLKFTNAGVRTG